jgi:hypothetical protein
VPAAVAVPLVAWVETATLFTVPVVLSVIGLFELPKLTVAETFATVGRAAQVTVSETVPPFAWAGRVNRVCTTVVAELIVVEYVVLPLVLELKTFCWLIVVAEVEVSSTANSVPVVADTV